ncbi:MAG: xseA [Haloplasmataceae bacterium]|jgi:exodeoxyribonuclease VII large subunit|nr:xseA [Haloplasmataceae bacterium]
MNKVPLTVSALSKYLKFCIDNDTNLQNVLLKGEISNFKHHSRGHFYFTLKDEQAQINAIMFASSANNVKFKLEDGMKVIVEGYVTLYVQGGNYQIYVSNITVDGIGELYLRFEQLKEKLQKQGLFDPKYKKRIPLFPNKIAVITSNTGAAIRDILTTIERRFPLVEVIVFPTLVQGENGKHSIVESIEKANKYPNIDVIILGRGGGSIEDLWCFNEEIVAHAIFNSKVPIISAVGHETDFTIADFVADLRAATPTAAAEMSVPNKQDIYVHLQNLKQRMNQIVINKLNNNQQLLNKLSKSYVFINPNRIYEQNYYRLDKLQSRLEHNSPINKLNEKKQNLITLQNKLNYLYEKNYNLSFNTFTNLINKLELLNPLNILQKGYSIVKKENQPIVSIENVNVGDIIDINLKDGDLKTQIIEKKVIKYDI